MAVKAARLSMLVALPMMNFCAGLPFIAHNPQTLTNRAGEISVAASGNYATYVKRSAYYSSDVPDSAGTVYYRNATQFQDVFVSYARPLRKDLEFSAHLYAIFQDNSPASGIPWLSGSMKWQFWSGLLDASLFLDVSLPLPWCAIGGHSGSCGLSYGFNPGFSLGKDYLYAGLSYAVANVSFVKHPVAVYTPVFLLGTKVGDPLTVNAEVSLLGGNFYDLAYDRDNQLIPGSGGAWAYPNVVFSLRIGYKLGAGPGT